MTLPALAPGDLGTDLDVTTDIGLRWNLVSGRANLARALARRLSTPRGALDWDPDYGFDLRGMLNASATQAQLAQLRGAIVAECKKEERVADIAARLNFIVQTGALTVALTVEDAEGPFDLILLVTSVTVDVLNQNALSVVDPGEAAGAGVVVPIGQVGPPGPPGPSGTGGGGGGGGVTTLDLSFPRSMGSSSGAAEVVAQLTADFAILSNGTLTAGLTGYAFSVSGTAIYRLYVGGTYNAIDGELVGSGTIATATPTLFQIVSTFANPTGARAVKLVIQSSAAGQDARLEDVNISFH